LGKVLNVESFYIHLMSLLLHFDHIIHLQFLTLTELNITLENVQISKGPSKDLNSYFTIFKVTILALLKCVLGSGIDKQG